jgi:hypothetical protein
MGVMNTRKKRTICLTLTLGCLLSLSSAARGEIIVDQPPDQGGGPAADTEFISEGSGQQTWQLLADNLVLSSSATVRRISWHGFYGGNFDEFPEAAPLSETFRIRFYEARAGDGLPDDSGILFEEFHANPLRVATGRTVAVGPQPPEFRFEVDLTNPVSLAANLHYWLEIVQLGDVDSLFRWERGFGPLGDFVFLNPNVQDWQSVPGNFAFQLSSVPEPATLLLLLFGIGFTQWGRRGRRVARR